MLDIDERNLILLEMQGPNPTVRMLRREQDRRVLLFLGMREQCAAWVRAEQGGGGGAVAGGCTKDTDCKGERICVSGACVYP